MTQHGCKKIERVYFGAPPKIEFNGPRWGDGRCTGGYCEGFYEVCACGFEYGAIGAVQVDSQCPHHKVLSDQRARELDRRTSLSAIRGLR